MYIDSEGYLIIQQYLFDEPIKYKVNTETGRFEEVKD